MYLLSKLRFLPCVGDSHGVCLACLQHSRVCPIANESPRPRGATLGHPVGIGKAKTGNCRRVSVARVRPGDTAVQALDLPPTPFAQV